MLTFRLRGVYFAAVTFGVAWGRYLIVRYGGDASAEACIASPTLFGQELYCNRQHYYSSLDLLNLTVLSLIASKVREWKRLSLGVYFSLVYVFVW